MATAELKEPVILFPMTSERFCNLPISERFKLELLNGEVYAAARPAPTHQHFVFQLALVIELWIKARKLGRILLDTLMKLDSRWTPAPDLCFLATKNLHRVQKKRLVGPVDLAVEVISSRRKNVDRVKKLAAYGRFGVAWYWIVDLERRELEEYCLEDRGYVKVAAVSFDQVFMPRLFPGLRINLASLEW